MAIFTIVSRDDVPIYEVDLGAVVKKENDAVHLHQFVIHAALDFVDERAWETNAMNLKLVDKFNDLTVCAFVTAGRVRFMLLCDPRLEDSVRNFFTDVHELFLRIVMNPFYDPNERIASAAFDARVKAIGRRHLG